MSDDFLFYTCGQPRPFDLCAQGANCGIISAWHLHARASPGLVGGLGSPSCKPDSYLADGMKMSLFALKSHGARALRRRSAREIRDARKKKILRNLRYIMLYQNAPKNLLAQRFTRSVFCYTCHNCASRLT